MIRFHTGKSFKLDGHGILGSYYSLYKIRIKDKRKCCGG